VPVPGEQLPVQRANAVGVVGDENAARRGAGVCDANSITAISPSIGYDDTVSLARADIGDALVQAVAFELTVERAAG
jgi:hypothetical protein